MMCVKWEGQGWIIIYHAHICCIQKKIVIEIKINFSFSYWLTEDISLFVCKQFLCPVCIFSTGGRKLKLLGINVIYINVQSAGLTLQKSRSHLVILYQFQKMLCSITLFTCIKLYKTDMNYAPWFNICSAPGVTLFI
jgi:hypothetical protein